MWNRTYICSICSRHYIYFTKYSPVLAALLDTELGSALIQNDGSLPFWQFPVALIMHRTYNFLTQDCQKFCSPFLKQSSLSLRVGLRCCWSYIYRHSVATVEDYRWLVHSHLEEKQLNDRYFIHTKNLAWNSDSVLLILNFFCFCLFVCFFYLSQSKQRHQPSWPCLFNFQQYLIYVLSKITTESISHANTLYQVYISKLCNTVPNLVSKIIT